MSRLGILGETAMNDSNGGNRGLRRAGAEADLAFAQWMRGHGMPNFPDRG
jgi:hypothetical protein